MGILDFFKRGKTEQKPESEKTPTAVDYVDWLFQHMLNTSQPALTIDTRRALPGSQPLSNNATPPPCLPETARVINRLKILTDITPIKQPESIEGTFDQPRKNLSIITRCRFQDTDTYSTCAIKIVIKGLNA